MPNCICHTKWFAICSVISISQYDINTLLFEVIFHLSLRWSWNIRVHWIFFTLQKGLCRFIFQTCHVIWFWLTRVSQKDKSLFPIYVMLVRRCLGASQVLQWSGCKKSCFSASCLQCPEQSLSETFLLLMKTP